MATYLVDTENVQFHWLDLLDKCSSKDKIIIYCTKKTGAVKYSIVQKLVSFKGKIEFSECNCGSPNALDFQLVAELGFMAGKKPKEDYIIVSNDRGFDVVIQHFNRIGYKFCRKNVATCGEVEQNTVPSSSIIDIRTPSGKKITETKEDVEAKRYAECKEEYIRLLNFAGFNKLEDRTDISEIVFKSMTLPEKNRLMDVYQNLVKRYGQRKGLDYYNRAKFVVKNISSKGPFPVSK